MQEENQCPLNLGDINNRDRDKSTASVTSYFRSSPYKYSYKNFENTLVIKAPPREHKMKAILLTTYFCIILRGTLSEFVNEGTDTDIEALPTLRVPPPGYTEHDGKYYKFYTHRKTWEEARALCKSDGADLAVIDSREEALYVKSLIGRLSFLEYPGAWIGFRDMGNGDWKTVIKSKPLENTGYNIWWPGSPKLIGGCGTIKTCSRYDALTCTKSLKFICKYEL